MKKLVFAVSLLALGYTASTPARADYGVVKWSDGWCRVWFDTSYKPWGGKFLWWKQWGWHHWYWTYHTDSWDKAEHKKSWAIAIHWCHQ